MPVPVVHIRVVRMRVPDPFAGAVEASSVHKAGKSCGKPLYARGLPRLRPLRGGVTITPRDLSEKIPPDRGVRCRVPAPVASRKLGDGDGNAGDPAEIGRASWREGAANGGVR